MVRLLHILAIAVMLAVVGVFGLWCCEWDKVDREIAEFLNRPGAVQRFSAHGVESTAHSIEDSPLVVQAKLYALCLDPPRSPEKPALVAPTTSSVSPAPALRPAAPSVRFRLCATSYYPNEPKRSMALISESGFGEGQQRWVKEGAQLGHFVIHEIRKGLIVYRDGEQLHEMTVEHGTNLPGIVRDSRLGSRQVSSAVDDAANALSVPAGPNSVESLSGN